MCAIAAILGLVTLAPAARAQTSAAFTLVGYEPLLNREMNAALAFTATARTSAAGPTARTTTPTTPA
jgi:hypothetical protein